MLAVIYDRASSQSQAGNWSRTDAEDYRKALEVFKDISVGEGLSILLEVNTQGFRRLLEMYFNSMTLLHQGRGKVPKVAAFEYSEDYKEVLAYSTRGLVYYRLTQTAGLLFQGNFSR